MVYILVFNGRYWQLLDDGTLVEVSPTAADLRSDQVILIDSSQAAASGSANRPGNSSSALPSSTSLATFFSNLDRLAPEQLPQSGFTTVQEFSVDRFANPNSGGISDEDENIIPPLNPDADITVTIEDNGDGFINMFEVATVDIFGESLLLFNNQPIEVTITDSIGHSISYLTTIQDDRYSLPARDLSGLAQGEVTVVATATDFYGNFISATDVSTIDTLAIINDDFITDGDVLLNAVEIADMDVSGTTAEINAGQSIDLTFTDSLGATASASTTIAADSSYNIDDLDLSALADGTIQVSATSTDIPGNIANNSFSFVKDTVATISVQFDGAPPYSSSEINAVTLSGTVTDVEPGQDITVNVTDGSNTTTVNVNVQNDGSWQTAALDLTGFNDGTLTADVAVNDVAGNPATNTTTAIKDTLITIDIDTDPDGLDINALRQGLTVTIKGTTTEVEVGQAVTLSFSDGINAPQTFTTSVLADGSWTTEVNVAGLNAFVPWNLLASVTDIAGNTATDAPPSLALPSNVVLSENSLADFPAGYSGTSTIQITGYDSVNFSAAQDDLAALTSFSTPLNVVVAGDGQSLLASAGATPVLGAVINGDGTITLTLYAPVDQPPLRDSVFSNLRIEATQNDADSTSETVAVNVPFSVRDTGPFTSDDAYTAVEQVPTSGNLLVNDNTLEGPLRIISIDVEGTVYSVSSTAPAVVTTTKGELTVHGNGHWTFVAARNLDNTIVQELQFSYGALDQDRDFDRSDVTITINDGVGGVFPGRAATIVESDFDDAASYSIDFIITAGTDDLDPASIVFSDSQLGLLNGLGYTSAGVALTYALTAGGSTLTASAGGNTVFELSLTAVSGSNGNLDATVSLNQTRPIDHVANESLVFPLAAQALDTDGTPSYSSASLIIQDGNNPTTSADAAALAENDLTPAAQATGNIQVNLGSDQAADIGFTATNQPLLSSNGETLQYQISGDGLTLTAYVSNPADPVFTAVIASEPSATTDSSLGYTVTLFQALDQLDSNGNSSDPLQFSLRYGVTDFDGDSVFAQLPVSVSDATAASGGNVMLQISETPKATANIATPASASVDFVITAGKDAVIAADFALVQGAAVLDSNGNPVTQNGQALLWQQVNDTTWQARTAAGTAVLALSLPETVSVNPDSPGSVPLTVTVLSELDHLDSGTPTDNITLPVTVNFTDSDGTLTALQADISVFDGRNPIALSAESLTVNESNTLNGGADSDEGLAYASRGSDKIVGIDVVLATVLTSGGVNVVLAANADANDWWIGSANGEEVFRLRVGFSGETEFQLSKPLDHPAGNGENNLPVNFALSVVDVDGDTSNATTLTVNVTDDIPVDADVSLVGTEGAGKTINVLANNKGGADGATLTQITYKSVNYTFTSDPEVITLMEGGQAYGTITAYSDGRITIQTNASLNASFFDSLTFQVTDADGDVEINTLNLDVRDEQGSITIDPLVTAEDTPLTLNLSANPGDLDDNEQVTAIIFDLAALRGGTLTLDGNPLSTDGSGNPQLTGSDLVIVDALTGEVQPNGVLVYTPALNISDPTHNVEFNLTLTVTSDSGTRTTNDNFDVSVTPVVDAPLWDNATSFTYTMNEDGTTPTFSLQANLFDTDGSESLSYRVNNIEVGLTLITNGRTLNNGDTLSSSELANLTSRVSENLAGQLQFDLFAISRENTTSATAEISQTITIDVAPVADTPTLATNSVFMQEDELVLLSDFISGALTDNDGSEALSFELTLPSGWMVSDAAGNETGLVSPGVYRVTDADVQADLVYLKPLEDISSVTTSVSIQVASVAIESAVDGIEPAVVEALSPARTVNIDVTGVVDNPAVGPGPDNAWSFSGNTIVGSFAEDSLIPLNFSTGTEDDDNSEIFDFVIRDLPDGVRLVDSGGNLAELNVLGTYNGKPVYAVSAAELANLFVQAPADYSGQILFELKQTNTEPDGDSATFDLLVDISVTPVVDTTDGIVATGSGSEDNAITLIFAPPLADIDGSETLTNVVLQAVSPGNLLVDGASVLAVPTSGLNIAQLAADLGTDFTTLINSGRLQYQPPQDSDDDINLPVIFEITDTSALGVQTVQTVTGFLSVEVTAIVDDTPEDGITRVDAIDTALISTDGSAISLAGAATFTEEDIDGSEYLDYISISIPGFSIPGNDGWFVTHPNGAIHDGNGNWLIPATGLTSDTVVDAAIELLAGATIVSDHVGINEVVISARVLDHKDDADIISDTLTIEFQAPGASGTASAISTVQNSIIDGQEDTAVDSATHLNINAAGDGNDVVSFRIDAADMPYGGRITGADVITEYAGDGTTVIAFVFTSASLGNLHIVGIDEDFAGAMAIPLNKVSTDPSGNTLVTVENIEIEIEPVVDSVDTIPTLQIIEDVPTPLNIALNNLLNDDSVIAGEGIESVLAIRFLALSEGSLNDPNNLLVDNGDGTFTLNDPSQLNEIFYIPPQHKNGSASFDIELTVQDQTTGITLGTLNNTVTDTVTRTVNFNIIADTDPALVVAPNQQGNEDSDISFSGLNVIDIDTDGSETLSLQMLGVPAGAVLFWNNGGNLQQLNNDGADGSGGFVWSFSASQLPDLVLRPPRDFAGDIELTLQATSMELSTQEIVTTSNSFVLEVLPVADGAEFYQDANTAFIGDEGTAIELEIFAQSLETVSPNETMGVQVVVNSSSDATALQGLAGVRTEDGRFAAFTSNGAGGFVATLVTTLTQLTTLQLYAGANAFGSLDIDILVGTRDRATVGGVLATDATDSSEAIVRSVTVDIIPQPDPPLINLAFDNIESAIAEIPLGLSITTINPAAGESSDLAISGLPEGIVLSAGTLSGNRWLVAEADVTDLSIVNSMPGETYTLTIEPRSTLNGETVSGGSQSLTINTTATINDGLTVSGDNTLTGSIAQNNLLIGADGSDTMSGSLLSDTYLFRVADAGSVVIPAQDVITNFAVNDDHIDLSNIITGLSTGADLDTIIDLNELGGSTTLTIDLGAGVIQSIELQGVSKDDLFGGAGWTDDADILQRMLDEQVLING